MAETAVKTMTKALLRGDEAVCPFCLKRLCRVRAGGTASGVELWCRRCKQPIRLELERPNACDAVR